MRFYGAVGFGATTDNGHGVWEDVITEKNYRGDVIRNARRTDESTPQVNANLLAANTISLVADAYATENFFNIRYITWMGARWTVASIEVQRPRLLCRLGGVYNGPTP